MTYTNIFSTIAIVGATVYTGTCILSDIPVGNTDTPVVQAFEASVYEKDAVIEIDTDEDMIAIDYEIGDKPEKPEELVVPEEATPEPEAVVPKEDPQLLLDALNDTIPCGGEFGNRGRVYIPTLNYSARLFDGNGDDAQYLCDLSDAAVCQSDSYLPNIIADHRHQGFSCINDAVCGYTKAYVIDNSGNVRTYVCTEKINGHNDGYNILDADYNVISTDRLVMYTCQDCWKNVTVTFWEEC